MAEEFFKEIYGKFKELPLPKLLNLLFDSDPEQRKEIFDYLVEVYDKKLNYQLQDSLEEIENGSMIPQDFKEKWGERAKEIEEGITFARNFAYKVIESVNDFEHITSFVQVKTILLEKIDTFTNLLPIKLTQQEKDAFKKMYPDSEIKD